MTVMTLRKFECFRRKSDFCVEALTKAQRQFAFLSITQITQHHLASPSITRHHPATPGITQQHPA